MILGAYPTLDPKMLPKLRVTHPALTAASRRDAQEFPVDCSPADSSGTHSTVWKLESTSWHAETHDLFLDYALTISVPAFLFGPYGVAASEGSVLGLAIQWIDADSSQRGTIPVGELAAADRNHPWQIRERIQFRRGILRGTLRLNAILYLKKAGTPAPQEMHLAQQAGTVFGVLQQDEIIIDGNGSVFPVRQIHDENAPLWRLICSWDDLSDPVDEETVCLELNKAHPDYTALYTSENGMWSPLMREVLAGALQVLITKAVTMADGAIHAGQDLHDGSVGQLVAYLQEIYDLDETKSTVSDEPEALAAKLRLELRQQMYK